MIDVQVDAVKRSCIKTLPDTLVIHLKRFEFDYETMTRWKIKDRYQKHALPKIQLWQSTLHFAYCMFGKSQVAAQKCNLDDNDNTSTVLTTLVIPSCISIVDIDLAVLCCVSGLSFLSS